jgi:peptidylprolyl isomerase
MKKSAAFILISIFIIMTHAGTAVAQEGKEITTPSGLKYKIIKKGNGIQPTAGDKVSVHYVGTLPDGTKFDSSRDRGEPFSFSIGTGQVIKGWDEGIALLHVGDKAILTIPPDLGYGAQAQGPIPANSTLIFEVELMDVKAKVTVKPYDVAGKDTINMEEGLKMILVRKGPGPKPEVGKTVSVHYTGYLPDGTKFDSSVERGEPISFPLGQGRVIKGWDMGIAALNVGSQARLIIPYQLGYGENGYPPIIPAKSQLIFDVELVSVQ